MMQVDHTVPLCNLIVSNTGNTHNPVQLQTTYSLRQINYDYLITEKNIYILYP